MKDIKKVVREWMGRMIKAHYETRTSCTSDENIDCPECGKSRAVSFYHDKGWMCVYPDCSFTFPEELMPPTPQQFEEYLNHKELERRIEKFLKS